MGNLVKDSNELFRKGDYEKALKHYELVQKQYPDLAKFFEINMDLCKQRQPESSLNKRLESPDIFITLTTISERLSLLQPVLESLHNQSLKPKKIILNLSEEPYLLDKGVKKDDPRLKVLISLPLVEINWTENTGPYRKIVPFMESFFSKKETEDKLFITVDDDTLYPDYFIETLYENYLKYDSVVAFRGRCITTSEKTIDTYSKWELGCPELVMNNLPTGKDGIIYSTKFFTKDFIDITAAKDLAPTADDLWIKWHCGLNGVKAVVLNPEAATSDYKSFPVVDYSDSYRNVSLFKAHNSNTSGNKNDISVAKLEKYFEDKYGYNLHTLCERTL